jgi:hypothetical protein
MRVLRWRQRSVWTKQRLALSVQIPLSYSSFSLVPWAKPLEEGLFLEVEA